MAIPALGSPLHREPMATRDPDGAQAAAVARIAQKLRRCFERAVERTFSDQVEVGKFFEAFPTRRMRKNRARDRGRGTEVTFVIALLKTFDIEARDGRRLLLLKPLGPEASRPDAENVMNRNRGPRRSRSTAYRRRGRTQKRLPPNEDQAIIVTECSHDQVGRIHFNFHLQNKKEMLHHIIQHLNSVELRECNRYPKGFICAALYVDVIEELEYRNFARAVVLGPGTNEGCIRVRYIDFNFEDEIENTWLRRLPRRLRRIAPLAYKAVVVNTDMMDPVQRERQAARMLSSEMTIVRVLKYQEEHNCYETYVYRGIEEESSHKPQIRLACEAGICLSNELQTNTK